MTFSTSHPLPFALIIALLLGSISSSYAQGSGQRRSLIRGYSRYYSATVGTGTTFYYGDFTSTGESITTPKPQINIGLRARLNEKLSYRGEFQFYSMSASDKDIGSEDRAKRNLNFRARNIELSGFVQYDFVRDAPFQSRYSRRPKINFFVFGGLGLTTNNPKAEFKGSYVALRKLETEGKSYGAIQPIIPLGIGVRFAINPETDILLDYGYRITFTDYLDDVSGKYLPSSSFEAGSQAQALADRRGEVDPRFNDPAFTATQYKFRGNSKRKDSYGILSVKYQYTFSKSQLKRAKRGVKTNFKSRLNRYK